MRHVLDTSFLKQAEVKNVAYPYLLFLDEFKKHDEVVVYTKAVFVEYSEHLKTSAMRWIRGMMVSKQFQKVNPQDLTELVTQVKLLNLGERKEVLKDYRLFAAAAAADKRIISHEKKVLKIIIRRPALHPHIGDFVWVNPLEDLACYKTWLANGCADDGHCSILQHAKATKGDVGRDRTRSRKAKSAGGKRKERRPS